MTCHDIQTEAAGLAALDAADPRRRAAFAHAEGCPACRAALAEAEALMRVLDQEMALRAEVERPEAATLARISRALLDQIAAEEAPEPERRRRPSRATTPLSAPVLGGRRVSTLGPAAILATVLVAAGFGKLWLAHPVGPGAGTSRAAALMALVTSVTVGAALTVGIWLAAAFPLASVALSVADSGAAPAQAAIGIRCAGFELMFAALPVLVAAGLYGREELSTRHPSARWAMVAVAGGGSLVAQAVLHHLCHAQPSLAHNLAFHTFPLLLAMAAAAWVGARLPAPRRL